MAYTKAEKEQILKDFDDPNRVVVFCGRHGYDGSQQMPPTSGCKGCWNAYYIRLYATTPPHLRAKLLEDISAVVHHLTEDIEKGNVDFELFDRPIIKQTKED